ncbi:MAG: type II toxin-antitoxin system HicA family toxin [Candidatus Electryonea clarkiae]|nr:type II toxin-antitoxin system HicA family toxin [Candidatus Electryonea clarkiae]MDP8286999.1 type II toxin-antitoxin system HicA family toxin [Candidatus Electryonea clarkiae]
MTRLPVISGKKAIRALKRIDYNIDHQTGSHVILRCMKPPYRRLTVPDHKELAPGTLRSIIREAGITVERFVELLRK